MPTTATIRPASDADAGSIAALLGELGYPASPGAIPARLAALRAEPSTAALVADGGDAVIGVITVRASASIHDDEPVGWITTLVVAADARAGGVGRLLVAAAEDWARERGCRRLSVTTALHRSGAHAFYERLGYQHSGRRYSRALAPSS